MTRLVGVVRWGIVPLLLLATVASVSPASATGTYKITTFTTSKGVLIFSLIPITVTFPSTTTTGSLTPTTSLGTTTLPTLTATYKYTSTTKPKLGAAYVDQHGVLIYKVMSGSTCQVRERLSPVSVDKIKLNSATPTRPYATEAITFGFGKLVRLSC